MILIDIKFQSLFEIWIDIHIYKLVYVILRILFDISKVEVSTGKKANAGTDGDVYITITGYLLDEYVIYCSFFRKNIIYI